ncbi:hypothetical protein BVY01_04960, partial [bacterium I07]
NAIICTVILLILTGHKVCTAKLHAKDYAQKAMGIGRIKGKVVSAATAKAINRCKVLYKLASQDTYNRGITTDEQGHFITAALTQGSVIELLVSAEGFEFYREHFIIDGGTQSIPEIGLEKKPVREKYERMVFRIHHRDPQEIFQLIQPFVKGLNIGFSPELKAISFYGPPSKGMELDMMIQEYDRPLQQIWLEIVLIQASGNGGGKPEYPAEIEPIVDKLQSLFKFGRYTIVGRLDAMGMENSTINVASPQGENNKSYFNFSTRLAFNEGIIRLEGLHIQVSYPMKSELATTANVVNGKTVILGASRGDAMDGSLITVLTAKLM